MAVVGEISTAVPSAFDRWHPAVAFAYFTAILVLTMAAFQPVCVALSLAVGLAYSAFLRGGRALVRSLRWMLPLFLFVAVFNPLFSVHGTTMLFTLMGRPVTMEALAYGTCMGGLLVATLVWFSNAAHVLTTDKVMSLLGRSVPVLALMISMVARLVPDFVAQGRQINDAERACLGAAPRRGKQRLAGLARKSSVLMGWSMENSLETADAMRARGWSTQRNRTSYRRYDLRAADIAALAVICGLGVLCAVLVLTCAGQFAFYPTLTPLTAWWGYVPYAALLLAGPAASAVQHVQWQQMEEAR